MSDILTIAEKVLSFWTDLLLKDILDTTPNPYDAVNRNATHIDCVKHLTINSIVKKISGTFLSIF